MTDSLTFEPFLSNLYILPEL